MPAWKATFSPAIRATQREATNRALGIAAEHVLGESVKNTPIEEGTLRRSHQASTDPDNRRAAVSVNTPYAVPVHEDLRARHKEGGAKYLERAMAESVPAVREIIANTMRGAF